MGSSERAAKGAVEGLRSICWLNGRYLRLLDTSASSAGAGRSQAHPSAISIKGARYGLGRSSEVEVNAAGFHRSRILDSGA